MYFDVFRIATIRKLNPHRGPKANYTRKSQEIGLTKKFVILSLLTIGLRDVASSVVYRIFFYKSLAKHVKQTLLFFTLKESHRFFRGSECSTAKQADVLTKLPGQQGTLLRDPRDTD